MRTSIDVHNFLVGRDIPHELFPIRGRLRSPERLAAVLDLPPTEVGKVVMFEGAMGPVAAVLPVGGAPDPERVRSAAGRPDLEAVDEARSSELTQFLAECIPPAGLPEGIETVVERSLARDEVLYFAGGDVRAVLKIRGMDLIRATGARVASLTAPNRTGRHGA